MFTVWRRLHIKMMITVFTTRMATTYWPTRPKIEYFQRSIKTQMLQSPLVTWWLLVFPIWGGVSRRSQWVQVWHGSSQVAKISKGTLSPAVCAMPPRTWNTMFKIKSKLINWSNSKNRDKLVAAFEEWNNNYLIKMIQIPKRKTSRFQSVFNQDIKSRNQLQWSGML